MKKWTGWMAALVCLCLLVGISACALAEDSGEAEDISVSEAKYELQDAEIECDWQYGVSNEPLPGQTAKIQVGKGRKSPF